MIYSCSVRTTYLTTPGSCLELNTTSTQSCRIMEISIMTAAATASAVSLAHPTTQSNTPTWLNNGTTGFIAESDTGAPLAKTSISISAITPAVLANATTSAAIRRSSMPATIGTGIVWTFPRGLYMPINSTGTNAFCIFNVVTGSAFDIHIVIDE